MSNISAPTLTSSLPIRLSVNSHRSASAPVRICVFCSTQKGVSPVNVEAAESLARVLHSRSVELVYGGGSSGLMGAVARERVRLGGADSVMGVIPYALVETERQGKGREGIPGVAATGPAYEGDPSLTEAKGERRQRASTDLNVKSEPPSSHRRTLRHKIRQALKGGSKEGDDSSAGLADGIYDGKTPPDSQEAKEAQEAWRSWDDIYTLPTDAHYGRVVGTPSLARRKAVMMDMVKNGGAGSGFIALPGGFGSLDEVLTVLTARQLGQHTQSIVLINVDGFWDGFRTWMDDAGQKGFLGAESRSYIGVVDTVDQAVDYLLDEANR